VKITFILNSIGISGGVRVVFEYANHLYERGHQVSVIFPLIPTWSDTKWYNIRTTAGAIKGIAQKLVKGNKINRFDLKAKLVRVTSLSERYIPDSDIVVATWWSTAYCVARYGDNKGKKFYLVQHYEIWGGPKEKVDSSYKLGLKIIAVSGWLKNIIESELGGDVEAVIPNAPSWEFYPENRKENKVVRILMPYRKERWKGFSDGVKAFEIARRKYANIQLVVFGLGQGRNLPQYVEFHRNPTGAELRKVYNSCDIFLFPSHCEGFGLPPMEAMACKIPVVTTNVGAIPDYTIPNKTALVSQPRDVEGLARNVIRLVENTNMRKRIAENGYNHVKEFTWGKATDRLERIFRKQVNKGLIRY